MALQNFIIFFVKEFVPQLIFEAVLLVRVFWMLHRYRGHTPSDGLRPLLERLTPAKSTVAADEARLRKVVLYVDAICSRLPHLSSDACVPRSLTLYHYAQKFGLDVQWNCGVRKTPDARLEGHAWLTRGEATFLEPDDRADGFAVTFRYP